jgi:hypothetical protein
VGEFIFARRVTHLIFQSKVLRDKPLQDHGYHGSIGGILLFALLWKLLCWKSLCRCKFGH